MVWAIAAAGFLGAVARFVLDGVIQSRFAGVFPLGTFIVNVSGSLLLGLLAGLVLYHGLDTDAGLVAGTGFLGAFTTFSTFAYETLQLVENGSRLEAALNVVLSIGAGLVAAGAGLGLAAALK